MKNLYVILGFVLLLMAGGLYYTLLYPPSIMKRNTENALQRYSDAVETQDRAKVGAAISELLTDDAKVHLEVTFSTISAANTHPMTQDFDKAQFLSFVDNILYTLTDYHTRPKLEEFTLNGEAANVKFKATQWADGPTYYTGVTLQAHFTGDTQCTGEAVFTDMQPKLKSANCAMLLRSVAKTDSKSLEDVMKKAQEIHDLQK